jgi:glycine oxidase
VNNPLFNYLPLVGSKGEMLFIESNELSEEVIIKGPIFIVPLGKKQFWVGATFNRTDKTSKTSVEGKNWLIKKLQQNLLADYKIIDHKAQVRATVVDRRPLLGKHPKHQNAYILNGLGTRGVVMSPLLSQWLYEYIEGISKLPPEVDIKRFENHYFRN